MSSEFTEYPLENEQVEVYASTNKYMRFAIERLDATYVPIDWNGVPRPIGHDHIAQWYDRLLPIELKDIRYLPAEKLMKYWINLFFSNRSRRGLIPTQAHQSGRRYYDPASGEWLHRAGDSRFFGVVEGLYASTVKMIYKIYEFLTWFPPDHLLDDNRSLLGACIEWADAFMQVNHKDEDNWYGHRVSSDSWTLYNYVHAGPPYGTPSNPDQWPDQSLYEKFEMQFRFALEGFPDSWWVIVGDYAGVAQAFVLLSQLAGDQRYAQFAADINEGLWKARFNQNTYLMPSTVTPIGPLPGDPGPAPLPGEPVPELKYQSDTDCLYWVHPLLAAYQLVGDPPVRPDLRPSWLTNLICSGIGGIFGRRVALRCQIRKRKQRLADLLDGDFPDKYLGMALALTLDWIRYGWVPEWRQFVSKIYHDGTRSTDIIYDDGKYNTLRMLIGAYKVTHDDFYLRIFDDAWGKFEELAQHPSLGDFFPKAITAGELHLEDNCIGFGEERPEGDTRPACYDPGQEGFLGFIVDAYLATVEAGEPRARYLTTAEAFAERILEAHGEGKISCSGHAFLRFALARGTLRRIHFTIWEDVVALVFAHNDEESKVARSNGGAFRQAVVYMDQGDYCVHYHRADGTESAIREFTMGANTVSIHILEDRLLVGEEGIA